MSTEIKDSPRSSQYGDTRSEARDETGSNAGSDSLSAGNDEIKDFTPAENQDEQKEEPLSKQPSRLQRIQTQLSFFNPRLKSHRADLVKKFVFTYLVMLVFILAVFPIYWGSFYQRDTRLHNLKMLVVIEDEASNGVEPVIGNTIELILKTEAVKARGGWEIKNVTEFRQSAEDHNNTVQEETTRLIHHQKYWSSIHVSKDASATYKDYIENGDGNITGLITSIYETGRDFINMNSYVTPQIRYVQDLWLLQQSNVNALFNSSKLFTLDEVSRVSEPLTFVFEDRIPFTNYVLTAPMQVGLIYIIIVTFFQVVMFGTIHEQVAKFGLKNHHFLLYRVLGSYLSYFVLSLGYCLVSLMFQVDFTKAFGKSGFLVYWMTMFLTMTSVGMVNELMFMVLLVLFPQIAGLWLLFWVLINISSTFSPIALCPKFFRFGYAVPIHNSYEITKVIFFDTYKGEMGRNYGIIVAWVVIATVSFCFVLPIFGKTMKARAIANAKKEAEKKKQEELNAPVEA